MLDSFKYSCNKIASELYNEYDYSKVESLIWVYLNMYFFKTMEVESSDLYRDRFMEFIEGSANFNGYSDKYSGISKAKYDFVYGEILVKYYLNMESNNESLSLKDMEEIYEIFLKEEVGSSTGSYYTPTPVVDFISHKSIIEYIKSKFKGPNKWIETFFSGKIIHPHMADVIKVKDILEEVKIIDIACGGGVFLREAYNQLQNMIILCCEYLGINFEMDTLKKSILGRNIYGIDLQNTSIEICRILLLMDIKEETKLNLIVGDALKDNVDLNISSLKYDIVLGNPPYIGEKGNKELFEEIRDGDFGNRYYEKGMDYFYFFIYKSWEILKEDGILAYITTNYFVTADGGKKLREFLKDNFRFTWIINLNEINIFAKAKGQHNIMFITRKSNDELETNLIELNNEDFKLDKLSDSIEKAVNVKDQREYKISTNSNLYSNSGYMLIQCDNKLELLNKIENNSNYLLSDLCNVNQGIVSGADRVTKSHETTYKHMVPGQGIFVLTRKELGELSLLEEKYSKFIKPFYKNSQIKKFNIIDKDDLYILYINDENLTNLEEYPRILAHLSKYKSILEERREVKTGTRNWFALQWPRSISIFEAEKIVSPQRALENSFAYSKHPLYASADIYYITKKDSSLSLLYILGILNSSLIFYYLFNRGKRKGNYLELYSTPLKNIPVVYTDNKSKIDLLENYVRELLFGQLDNRVKLDTEQKIDDLVFSLYKISNSDRKEILGFKK